MQPRGTTSVATWAVTTQMTRMGCHSRKWPVQRRHGQLEDKARKFDEDLADDWINSHCIGPWDGRLFDLCLWAEDTSTWRNNALSIVSSLASWDTSGRTWTTRSEGSLAFSPPSRTGSRRRWRTPESEVLTEQRGSRILLLSLIKEMRGC